MEKAASLSLASHCSSCRAQCCHNSMMIANEEDHTRLIKSDAPDYFATAVIPEGNFFVLDFLQGPCPYLGEDKRCTVEEVKPALCKTYPVQPAYGVAQTVEKSRCPAVKAGAINNEYRRNAVVIINTHVERGDDAAFEKAAAAYHAFLDNHYLRLRKLGAIVRPPADRHPNI